MSDFLENAPLLVLRKIYEACDNCTKYKLKKILTRLGQTHRLEQSGALNYKERIWCVACQMEQFYDLFCEKETDPASVAFRVNYRETSRFDIDNEDDEGGGVHLIHPNVDRVQTFRKRKIHTRRRDQIEANHVFTYFESRINAVFNTRDMQELERHIAETHARTLHLPLKFLSEVLERRDRILLAGSARRAIFYANQQFKKLQDIGGSFREPILEVDGDDIQWNMAKPVHNFFVYLGTLMEEHDDLGTMHPSVCKYK